MNFRHELLIFSILPGILIILTLSAFKTGEIAFKCDNNDSADRTRRIIVIIRKMTTWLGLSLTTSLIFLVAICVIAKKNFLWADSEFFREHPSENRRIWRDPPIHRRRADEPGCTSRPFVAPMDTFRPAICNCIQKYSKEYIKLQFEFNFGESV